MEGGHGAGFLFGVVVLPLDVDRPGIARAVEFDDQLLDVHRVAPAARGDEIPAQEFAPHRPVTAEAAGPGGAVDHLHPLDVGRVDPVGILAHELDRAHPLPHHVAGIEVEADDVAAVAGPLQEAHVVAGALDVAHGTFARVALQVERHAILPAGVEHRGEALREQFEAHLQHLRDRAAADGPRARRELEPVAPAVGRRADEAGYRDVTVLVLAEKVGQAHRADQIFPGLLVDQLPHLVGHEIRVGARRLMALLAPRDVGLDRCAADELQRLRRGLVTQRLPLEVRGDGEDLEPALLGLRHPALGVGLGTAVGVALGEVELPGGLLPAVEARVGDEVEPGVLGDVAELAADKADLVVRTLAAAVCFRLVEAHRAYLRGDPCRPWTTSILRLNCLRAAHATDGWRSRWPVGKQICRKADPSGSRPVMKRDGTATPSFSKVGNSVATERTLCQTPNLFSGKGGRTRRSVALACAAKDHRVGVSPTPGRIAE